MLPPLARPGALSVLLASTPAASLGEHLLTSSVAPLLKCVAIRWLLPPSISLAEWIEVKWVSNHSRLPVISLASQAIAVWLLPHSRSGPMAALLCSSCLLWPRIPLLVMGVPVLLITAVEFVSGLPQSPAKASPTSSATPAWLPAIGSPSRLLVMPSGVTTPVPSCLAGSRLMSTSLTTLLRGGRRLLIPPSL